MDALLGELRTIRQQEAVETAILTTTTHSVTKRLLNSRLGAHSPSRSLQRKCGKHDTGLSGFHSAAKSGGRISITEPPEKGRRPVIIVSPNARNQHPRATSVLVIPLSTSIHKLLDRLICCCRLEKPDCAWTVRRSRDNIAVCLRAGLSSRDPAQRALSHTKICQLASLVKVAMGCLEQTEKGEK